MAEPAAPVSADTRLILKVMARNKAESHRQLSQALAEQKKLLQRIEVLEGAFPNQDPASHRRFHENVMEWYELRNRIFRESLVNIAKVGSLGGCCWLLWLLWQYFKYSVQK